MFIQLKLSKQAIQSIKKRTQGVNTEECTFKKKQHTIQWEKTYQEQINTCQNTPKDSQQSSEGQFKTMKPKLKEFNFQLSQKQDQHRHVLAHKDGGLTCDDPKQIDKLRSVGKQMIKLVGRKILSGQFNLTKISIPLKSCYPKTALYNSVKGYSIFPYFMNTAAMQKDPLQRFKLTLTCLVAQPYYLNMFLKPLNPVLGETLQAKLCDGTQIYAQQISHHPPISYFYIVGPNKSYTFSGYYDIEINPGLNSLTIKNKGMRKFTFKDGTEIQSTYSTNEFSGTFFGTSRIQELQSFKLVDKKNNISCQVPMGKQKKKPSDYIKTDIVVNKTKIAQVSGTCLGYVEINNKRYWDGRQLQNLDLDFGQKWQRLPSDWQFRQDLQLLAEGNLQKGQKSKQLIENAQRADAKLRKKYAQHNKAKK